MSAVCDVCGKAPRFGKRVSFSHRVSSRRWNPNIQIVRVRKASGEVARSRVCVSCLKAGKVQKAVR